MAHKLVVSFEAKKKKKRNVRIYVHNLLTKGMWFREVASIKNNKTVFNRHTN